MAVEIYKINTSTPISPKKTQNVLAFGRLIPEVRIDLGIKICLPSLIGPCFDETWSQFAYISVHGWLLYSECWNIQVKGFKIHVEIKVQNFQVESITIQDV